MEGNLTLETYLRQLLTPIIIDAVENAIARHFPIQPAPQQPVPDILDADGAAALLGLSKSYIYKLTHNRRVPYYTTGKRIYFKREDLIGWVTRVRVKPQDEIEQEAENYLARNRRK